MPGAQRAGVRTAQPGHRSPKRKTVRGGRTLLRAPAAHRARVARGSRGQTRSDLFLLGDTYASQRKYPESERSFAQLLDVQRRTSVPESVAGFSVASSLGWAQLRQGRLADAERTFRDALAGLTRVAPDSWERFNVASMLGATLSAQRRFSDAEPLLTSGYEGMDTRKPANANAASRFTRPEAGAAILQLYADWGNTARRAEWEERLKN